MGRSALQHLAFRVLICCGFAYARAAVIAPQFNVTSLDGRLTIELDSSTGLINRIYTRSSNTSSYVASDAAGGSVLQGCAIVPGSLAIVPSAQNLGVQRSLFCADGEGGTNNSFIVDITDTFTPMAASVQWTTSYLVDEAPGCQAQRCQLCVPSNGSISGSCCGDMQCFYDTVFEKFLCLPDQPWICGGEALSAPPRVDPPGYAGTLAVPLLTSLNIPSASGYWTTRGRGNVANGGASGGITVGPWSNPLEYQSLPNQTGAVYRFGAMLPNSTSDSITVPVVSVTTPSGLGVSLLLDPTETMLEVLLNISSSGDVGFERRYQRQTAGNPRLTVTQYIVGHGPDWRPALGFMVNTFPAVFKPVNEEVMKDFYGLGSHSWNQAAYDAERARELGFQLNFDVGPAFKAYDGLFIPYQNHWLTQGSVEDRIPSVNMTYAALDRYAQGIAADGFRTLSYFTVGRWGVNVTLPAPNSTAGECGTRPPHAYPAPCPTAPGSSKFLQDALMTSLLETGWSAAGGYFDKYQRNVVGAVLMDPYDPKNPLDYESLLLEQASRHVYQLPHFQGMYIDSLGLSEVYDTANDDGVSWVPAAANGTLGPARSLRVSFRGIIELIANALHNNTAPKVLFANCDTVCRVDLVTHVDGIVSTSSALNALAWAAVSKPAVAWTVDLSPLSPSQLDAYFGQHLLMRVYPLAPMPLNTGAVQPGNGTLETVYRDFAPLFGALRGVRWALREDPASISRPDSFGVNTFDVTDGSGGVYVVVLALVSGGPESEIVSIGAADAMIVSALYPGASGWKPLGTYTPVNGRISVDVPVVRGVALLSLST